MIGHDDRNLPRMIFFRHSGMVEHMLDKANWLDDVFAVVRTVGERTENGAVQAAQEILGSARVVTVTGTPFSETLRKSFVMAIEHNFAWTFCIDADVLLVPEALVHLRRSVQVASGKLYGMQGLVLDKWFGGMRPAALRIYRTTLLQEALHYIPSGDESKRPETFVRRVMQRRGYEWVSSGILCGLHDFEQYYKDVYRTAFFHTQKHRSLVPLLTPYWERMSVSDPDFLVALRGMRDGFEESQTLGLDVRNFSERAALVLEELGLHEKEHFTLSGGELDTFVDQTIASWQVPPEYNEVLRFTRRPSRVAQLLGPQILGKLGLSAVLEP